MTEGEENIIIKGVLLEAISRDFSEELSNNKEVSVSPRFKRQMMAMMNNPNKWAERHKRDYRRRFVKVVATIVLTCSLPFGVLTVASPTVRAAVIDWVVEWYESSIIYKFFGESDSTKLPLYEVIDLPFDYTRIGIPQDIAASGPISGRKNTNIWDESCPIDQTWSIASLGNNQQVKIINNLSQEERIHQECYLWDSWKYEQ